MVYISGTVTVTGRGSFTLEDGEFTYDESVYPGLTHLKPGDLISAYVDEEGKLLFRPAVYIVIDVKEFLYDHGLDDDAYDELAVKAKSAEELPNIVDELAVKNRSRVTADRKWKDFYEAWYQERIHRYLEILEVKPDEDIDPLYLLRNLLANAYTCLSIDTDHARSIYEAYHPPGSEEKTKYTNLYRTGRVYRRLEKLRGDSSCIPITPEVKALISPHLPLLLAEVEKGGFGLSYYKSSDGIICLYLPLQWRRVTYVAEHIKRLMEKPLLRETKTLSEAKHLSSEQLEAVKLCLSNNIALVEGPAGTGKTEVIKTIIASAGHEFPLVLTFTAKAAENVRKRVPGVRAYTIHYLIQHRGIARKCKLIIIDEAGQVALPLFYTLLMRIDPKAEIRLILIGDNFQLQPIDWGYLFSELLKSRVKRVSLTQVYRHGKESGILTNARRIRDRDEKVPVTLKSGPDFLTINASWKETRQYLLAIVTKYRDEGDTTIKVITPYRSPLQDLNLLVRSVFNPRTSGGHYKVGDLVSFTQNRYDIELINGNEGRVVDVSRDEITCDFNGKQYKLKTRNSGGNVLHVGMITHNYCITVHRAQGSEYKTVIIIIGEGRGDFVDAHLLYTAITRAKERCIVVGDIASFTKSLNYRKRRPYDCLHSMI